MKKLFLFLLLLCGVAGAGVVWTDSTLAPEWERVLAAEENVTAAAHARAQCVPDLCRELKNFSSKEAMTRLEAEELAKTVLAAKTVKDLREANEKLSADIGTLLLAAENYSYLTAREEFQDVQTSVAAAENRLTVARAAYNRAADAYNGTLRKFPISIFAGCLGYESAERMSRLHSGVSE